MKITLVNLEQATAQQVFDQVANHLLTQMQSCRIMMEHGGFSCAYRSADGKLACAAGCLISDEEMAQVYEANCNTGAGWGAIIDALNVSSNHEQLIVRLQIIHDDADPSDWKELLEKEAVQSGLNTEVLNAYSS
jgi:hypothetical protein